MNNIVYSLACLAFCIMIGGAVYEHIAVVPQWAAAPPHSLLMFQGNYGLRPEPFWMAIHPVAIILLGISIILNRKKVRRMNLMVVFTGYLTILAITAIYFVPELLSITNTPYTQVSDQELTSRATTWERLSLIRLACLLVMAVYLLLGLAKGGVKIRSMAAEN
ncbi:MAG: hypothetical protein EOO01_06485 [Chitinophagaceae bacterium]|nr:MAG: hypothetical protein EOO01_06485 [Chitinophagaceae bacterium]